MKVWQCDSVKVWKFQKIQKKSKKFKKFKKIQSFKKSNISKISKISKSILKSAVLPASMMPLFYDNDDFDDNEYYDEDVYIGLCVQQYWQSLFSVHSIISPSHHYPRSDLT